MESLSAIKLQKNFALLNLAIKFNLPVDNGSGSSSSVQTMMMMKMRRQTEKGVAASKVDSSGET
jgi:hypothetical protein